MKLILSRTMGYCKGVSRALELATSALQDAKDARKPVYSLGKLIHNDDTCAFFADQGMKVITGAEGHDPGLVVLRAHGVPDKVRSSFLEAGFDLVDATCPVVKHNLSRISAYATTHTILIVGHPGHPETLAMRGVQLEGKLCDTILISGPEDVGTPEPGKSYVVFVQTTFDQGLWNTIQRALRAWEQYGCTMLFANEVCPSSINRRQATLELTDACDAVVVIGGKESANTRALYQLVREKGKMAWHIENETEITDDMRSYDILGITAGASTSSLVIQRVIDRLQQE
nr:4-hydroxy-3-methylbut-2-enyl diphosphate reductase [uncultured Sphaerochaeta sp.]